MEEHLRRDPIGPSRDSRDSKIEEVVRVKLGEPHSTGIGSKPVVTRRAVVLAEIMPSPLAARYGLTSDRAV